MISMGIRSKISPDFLPRIFLKSFKNFLNNSFNIFNRNSSKGFCRNYMKDVFKNSFLHSEFQGFLQRGFPKISLFLSSSRFCFAEIIKEVLGRKCSCKDRTRVFVRNSAVCLGVFGISCTDVDLAKFSLLLFTRDSRGVRQRFFQEFLQGCL